MKFMSGFSSETRQYIARELEMALISRQQGNEGRARVCARRAAGAAAKEFLIRKGIVSYHLNAWDALNFLAQEDFPVEIQPSLRILTMRLDENFSLPVEADVIQEAQKLCEILESFLEKGEDD